MKDADVGQKKHEARLTSYFFNGITLINIDNYSDFSRLKSAPTAFFKIDEVFTKN